MSYDLGFTVRPGATAPTIPELKEWFAARPCVTLEDDLARYINEATGIGFRFSFRPSEPEEPAHRLPLDLTMGHGPHTRGLEAEEEVRALVARFSLLVNDPQMDGMGEGEFTTEKFLSGYAAFNRFSQKVAIQFTGQRPPVLSSAKLEAAWRWNRGRAALAESSGDAMFVPSVMYAEGRKKGTAETFVAWVEGIPARVPEVDMIQGALGRVAWSEIGPALELARREESPLPHYLFEGEAVARVAAALASAPPTKKPPVLLDHQQIATAEMMAEVIAELEPPVVKKAKKKPAAKAKKARPAAKAKKKSKPATKAKKKSAKKPSPRRKKR